MLIAGPAFAKTADLAGSWYPADGAALRQLLGGYLEKADIQQINGDIRVIIAPHAGYYFSAPVAAYAFKAVQGRPYKTVIVLGFSHRKGFNGIAVLNDDYFETPMGRAVIDKELAGALVAANPAIKPYPPAFDAENSIEMMVPFIQIALPEARIVPLAFGDQSFANYGAAVDALQKTVSGRNDILIAASTDMSHYLPYDEAKRIDAGTIELVKAFNGKEIYRRSMLGDQLCCGFMPVASVLSLAQRSGWRGIDILKYANSGDTAGDRSRVVGYFAAAIYTEAATADAARANLLSTEIGGQARNDTAADKKEEGMLNAKQREWLLKLARDTIVEKLKSGKTLEVKQDDPVLNREMGAFVTLHKRGELRGCIGNIIGRGPLCLTVRDMAVEAALHDPRFTPVGIGEMRDIDVEISVLSELEKVDDVNKIVMGKHGVLVRKGSAGGVYLPQVATETGWTREEFLTSLCAHKAGLLPDAWKHSDCDIFIFTAEVFGEKTKK